ncbi:MAG: hypothetical protein ACRDO7_15805, partial [Nocardioidaceae bacterium]
MTTLGTIVLSPARALTWRHWVYLVLGGAVFLPYVFIAMYLIGASADASTGAVLIVLAVVVLGLLAAVSATGSLEA